MEQLSGPHRKQTPLAVVDSKNAPLIGKQWVVFYVVEMQLQSWLTMSAFGGKADINGNLPDIRF